MGFPLSFFIIIELNNSFLHILLQDKYNIDVLTVNIEFMWLGTKRTERLANACLSLVSKPHHINSIFTINAAIMYISLHSVLFIQTFPIVEWLRQVFCDTNIEKLLLELGLL